MQQHNAFEATGAISGNPVRTGSGMSLRAVKRKYRQEKTKDEMDGVYKKNLIVLQYISVRSGLSYFSLSST